MPTENDDAREALCRLIYADLDDDFRYDVDLRALSEKIVARVEEEGWTPPVVSSTPAPQGDAALIALAIEVFAASAEDDGTPEEQAAYRDCAAFLRDRPAPEVTDAMVERNSARAYGRWREAVFYRLLAAQPEYVRADIHAAALAALDEARDWITSYTHGPLYKCTCEECTTRTALFARIDALLGGAA